MKTARMELVEGLGLSALALGLSGLLLFAAAVAVGKADYLRIVGFGVPGLIALYWSIRFTRAEIARYRAERQGFR